MKEVSDLQKILPDAVDWAESEAADAAGAGKGLNQREIEIARAVGVAHPERVHVLIVDSLPLPEKEPLRSYALSSGLLGEDSLGVTLGYAVFIRKGFATTQVLSHELRHVRQFEEYGSIREFLPVYLKQIALFGYWDAPLEVDARQHEIDGLSGNP